MAAWLDGSAILASCFQLGPRAPADWKSISHPSSPASSWRSGNLVWSMGQSLRLCLLLFCPRQRGDVENTCRPPSAPQTRSRSPCGWDQLRSPPSHPLKEATCKCGSKLEPRVGSHQTQSLPGKGWTASVSPLAPPSIHAILMAAEQKEAVASLLLLQPSMVTPGLSKRADFSPVLAFPGVL